MVIKHILEGARRFKPAQSSTAKQPAAEAGRGRWPWPQWVRVGLRGGDKYLIAVRPLRLPRF